MKTVVHNTENKSEILVLFFSGNSYLSNFFRCSFEVDGVQFTSTEQFFHYQKAHLFKDQSSMAKILATKDPKKQKQLGRKVKNYEEKVWSDKCYMIMKRGLYAKFKQNPVLKERLLSISNARFVEASPYDKKWGIGIQADHPNAATPSKWPGTNLLGKALTEVRDMLKETQSDNETQASKVDRRQKPHCTTN
jgi:ribA/ribD-fused uncharacterized protein